MRVRLRSGKANDLLPVNVNCVPRLASGERPHEATKSAIPVLSSAGIHAVDTCTGKGSDRRIGEKARVLAAGRGCATKKLKALRR